MKPLHDHMQPSSALTPEPEAQKRNYRRERPSSSSCRRRRSSSHNNNNDQPTSQNKHVLLITTLLLSLLQSSTAQQQPQHQAQHRGLSPTTRTQRTLSDGISECANCSPNDPNKSCAGSTISDEHCAPCATGQKYWPCNLMDECYCKDLLAEAALEVALEEAEAAFEKCDIPLCVAGYSGNAVVPYTKCEQYVTCTGGVAGPTQFCDAASMIYSSAIQACNIKSLATCQADPACPPTMVPVTVVSTERPTVGSVESERPTGQKSFVNKGDTTSSVGSGSAPAPGAAPGAAAGPGAATGAGTATGEEEPSPRSTTTLDPLTMEGMIVMDAHMAANKIMLTRQLLTSPDGSRGIQSAAMGKSNDDFSYSGFTSSLQLSLIHI